MGKLLSNISSPADIKVLSVKELEQLAQEIREFLIKEVSITGGHLASNLGAVELTLALHKIFDSPIDKIIWDVGHQSYVHKIITGRKNVFTTLRQLNGISGFPKVNESIHDCFNTGHSSTSISAALGVARARDIKGENYSVISIIGDGAMTGGMSFEALNDAGRSPNNLIVILNDNEMSISKNVGGLSRHLSKIRTQPIYFKLREDVDDILNKTPFLGKFASKALARAKGTIKYLVTPGIIFEELGFRYIGPIDGHNLAELILVLSRSKAMKGPILIHVKTQKGKGYIFAEESPRRFHGISPFEIDTGEVKTNNGSTYSKVFGNKLTSIAESAPGVVAITAAMPHGTGLHEFSKKFPNKFFDVGIAEQHAVTFAAGLSRNGMKPVVAIYSSFLQRAYDQILHDVSLQNLHVVFAIDRAGIVGEDGETHHGLYDISFLQHMPNMTIMAPADYSELEDMLEYAVLKHKGPIAIRYPRGNGAERLIKREPIRFGKGIKIREGRDIAIISAGNMLENSMKCAEILGGKGISAEVINARFIKPIDSSLIIESAMKTGRVVTLENGTLKGGFGANILQFLYQKNINSKVKMFGFPDIPITHGRIDELMIKYKLDAESLASAIIESMTRKGRS
jgi:1-deoxy-D-xylulose-5-phosphate synthase